MSVKRRDRTIFREILTPLLVVLILEMLFMMSSIVFGDVIGRLNQNAMDILAQQTENRGNYLLNDMIGSWSNLGMLSDDIDAKVQSRLEAGSLSLEALNTGSADCISLLREIAPELATTMYAKKISGIFVIFDTQELTPATAPDSLQGLYLRDLDPTAAPSQRNADLLWERAPVDIVRSGYIATDSGWKPSFSAQDTAQQDFFCKPYQTAYADEHKLKEKDYGYWTTSAYCLDGDNRTAISYSIPLILEDGTVYGVLGIELLTDYVRSLLPETELLDDRQSSYLLAFTNEDETQLSPILIASDTLDMQQLTAMGFALAEDGSSAENLDKTYYGAAKKLVLYSNNAPFDSDQWYLLGISSKKSLFAFSGQIQQFLFVSIILAFIIGLIGILYASFRLSKPIRHLSDEVAKAQTQNSIPVLPATGIREIDRFADSITRLGREIERERDSDNLTKLYARRGFKREADQLFLRPDVLRHAGLLMIDLDNLKSTNDRFGHNFGDLYIRTAGKCFVTNTPENTLCARMSGDEFIIFFYGYDSQQEIREKVAALYQAIREVEFVLPDGENMGLSASGGVAWYPEDSENLSDLMKFADFAMYQVKRSKKGEYKEFVLELYEQQLLEHQRLAEENRSKNQE